MASEENDAQTDFEIGSHGWTSLTSKRTLTHTLLVVSLPLPRGDQLEVSCCRWEHNLRIPSPLQSWRPFFSSSCWLLGFLGRRLRRSAMLWWRKGSTNFRGSTNWLQRSARMNSRALDNLAPLTSRKKTSTKFTEISMINFQEGVSLWPLHDLAWKIWRQAGLKLFLTK